MNNSKPCKNSGQQTLVRWYRKISKRWKFFKCSKVFSQGESIFLCESSHYECDSGRYALILHTSWPGWTSTLHWYLCLFIWGLLVTVLSPTNIRFNIKDPILIQAWVFVVFGNNLNEILGSYHATSVGAGSPNTRNLWGIPSLKIRESQRIPFEIAWEMQNDKFFLKCFLVCCSMYHPTPLDSYEWLCTTEWHSWGLGILSPPACLQKKLTSMACTKQS
jgi:hypothetical protein